MSGDDPDSTYFGFTNIPCAQPECVDNEKRSPWLRHGMYGSHAGSKVPHWKRKAKNRARTKAAKRHKAYLKELARQKLNRKECE